MPDTILVVDCGAQYGHLIARAIRRMNVFSELVYPEEFEEKLAYHDKSVRGIIISGGPSSVYEKGSPQPSVLHAGLPVLGICYGHQYIAHAAGGRVEKGKGEYGHAKISVKRRGRLLEGIDDEEDVWMSHGDLVAELPEGFSVYASSESCPVAAYGSESRRLYGVQFHPEVAHTDKGERILKNFAYSICNAQPNWSMEDYAEKAISLIKEKAGDSKVLLALSGGVDSATAAALGAKAAIRLIAVYVDTGLMRKGETEEIRNMFRDDFPVDLRIVRSAGRFYAAIKGVKNPERKRRIIGDLFAEIFEAEMLKCKAQYLMQGTIYPDRIESGQASRNASVIKTHHNVGSPLIEEFRKSGRLIEPLADLYKDEVREIAAKTGLPEKLVWRQPFPGPGMAVRIEGSVTKRKLRIVRGADAIVREEIENALLRQCPWQYVASLPNSKAAGVRGDDRAYGNVIVVRAVESREAMTASAFHLPHELEDRITSRITSEISDVVRVLYDGTPKPPATIEWE